MPSIVTRPVIASLAIAIQFNCSTGVWDNAGYRQARNATILIVGFCHFRVVVVVMTTLKQKPFYANPFFGEGIVRCPHLNFISPGIRRIVALNPIVHLFWIRLHERLLTHIHEDIYLTD